MKAHISVVIALFLLIAGIVAAQEAIEDPFKQPISNRPNSTEYRFKFDVIINTPDEFISFLR